jgi:hypothetical protein
MQLDYKNSNDALLISGKANHEVFMNDDVVNWSRFWGGPFPQIP